jgi:pantoate--beta-alanine ligase
VVGLVPTMGFFHEGHLALMTAARAASDTVVVSHFVNPLQFGDQKDLDRYPRDLERDRELARSVGVDLLFAPTTEEMYPQAPATMVTVARVADHMEGPSRPGHFEGVATVVAKLFAGLQPHLAFFGKKDAQQLVVVKRLASDLSFPVTISGQPTVREADGLALSSRNVFLPQEERHLAVLLSSGLFAAASLAESGTREGRRLIRAVEEATRGLQLDYVELASQDEAAPLSELDRPAFLAVAARVGGVRLIDNVSFDVIGGQVMADRGKRLAQTSLLYR